MPGIQLGGTRHLNGKIGTCGISTNTLVQEKLPLLDSKLRHCRSYRIPGALNFARWEIFLFEYECHLEMVDESAESVST